MQTDLQSNLLVFYFVILSYFVCCDRLLFDGAERNNSQEIKV